jgi:hypothetical protein
MRVTTPREFSEALGCREILHTPSAQWRGGPFVLDAILANGAATSVDLGTHDAWYGDVGVRQAYALVDAATTRVKATVQIEAVEIWLLEGLINKLDVDTKDNLLLSATAPYIEANVAGTITKINLVGHMTELTKFVSITQASAADGERGYIQGRPNLLFSPLRLDLENDTLTLKSDADIALGAVCPVKVRLHGWLIPGTVGVSGMIGGANCAAEPSAQNVSASKSGLMTQVGVLRPYGT